MLRLPAARVENTFVRGVDFGTPWGVGLRCAVYRYYGVFLFVRFVHILIYGCGDSCHGICRKFALELYGRFSRLFLYGRLGNGFLQAQVFGHRFAYKYEYGGQDYHY